MENKFEIKSGKVVLSDPCYELGTWCQGVIDNVKNGVWRAEAEFTESWGRRVAVLITYHKEYPATADYIQSFGEFLEFDGGVDSGQFGHFDFDGYRKDETIAGVERMNKDPEDIICEDEPWYSICCDRTHVDGKFSMGVIPLGAVSSSGLGDGSYPTYGIKNEDGQYVGFATFFITDDEDDEHDPAGGTGLHSHE